MATKKTSGRPPYVPTAKDKKQVEMLIGMGMRDYEVAKVLGITMPTMRKHFFHEMELGHLKANAQVAQSLFKIATNADHPKSVTACIFWLKTRGGWVESKSVEQGKKEAADVAALNAEQGTDWERLLQ